RSVLSRACARRVAVGIRRRAERECAGDGAEDPQDCARRRMEGALHESLLSGTAWGYARFERECHRARSIVSIACPESTNGSRCVATTETRDRQDAWSQSPLRYSPSGKWIETGWSIDASSVRRTCISTRASAAAPAMIFRKRSGPTAPEQEKVSRWPPGARSFIAHRLMSLYARAAFGTCFSVGANFGGSSTMRP